MSTTLEIDRLAVRYHNVRTGEAERLDRALSVMLARELTDAVTDRMSSTDREVCIPELHIEIEIDDPDDARQVARRWADIIVDEIIRSAPSSAGVVTYRRRRDALVDLVESVGRGQQQRLWAWQQVGLVRSNATVATTDDVVAALCADPDNIPGVLRQLAVGPHLRFEPRQWMRLAAAVDRLLGRPVPGGQPIVDDHRLPEPTEVEGNLGWLLPWSDATESEGFALARLLACASSPSITASESHLRRLAAQWRARAQQSTDPLEGRSNSEHDVNATSPSSDDETPPSGQIDDASADQAPNSQVCQIKDAGATPLPHLSADRPRADRDTPVVRNDADRDIAPVVRDDADRDTPVVRNDADRDIAPVVRDDADRDTPVVRDDADPVSVSMPDLPAEVAATNVGGVAFTIHALVTTGLVEQIAVSMRDPANVLGRVLARASGAGPTDPVVRAVAGCDTSTEDDIDAGRAGVVASWAEELVEWLRQRLEAEDADLGWFWRRPAVIRTDPGWVEFEFPLDSVDFSVRRAGLDLDPGFVWWLGSVVRYRYV